MLNYNYCWIIIDDYDNPILYTIKNTRKQSIDKYVKTFAEDWKYWYRQGCRCEKITLREGW